MAPARAYIFVGLNVVRALSIVALILLFASSIVTMVHDIQAVNAFIAAGKQEPGNSTDCTSVDTDYISGSTVPNQPAGAFWAVLNRLLIIFQVIVLILSELRWPISFFNKYFPVLGDEFGLGALGIIQGLIGAAVLSHHVDEFSLVSAFFLFSIGCLNMLLGLIFRESAKPRRSLTAWRESNKEVLPTSTDPAVWLRGQAQRSDTLGSTKSSMGFGRQGEKAAMALGATVVPPQEAVATFMPKPVHVVRVRSPAPSTRSAASTVVSYYYESDGEARASREQYVRSAHEEEEKE